MFCSGCGKSVLDNARFCTHCGIPIATTPGIQEPDTSISTIKLWNPDATANWSLLLSPIFGSYMQALNWRSLGETNRASSSMRWFYFSLLMYVLVYPLMAIYPLDSKASSDINAATINAFALFYFIFWYLAVSRNQVQHVKGKFGTNYIRKPWAVPLLIGFALKVALYFLCLIIISSAVSKATSSLPTGDQMLQHVATTNLTLPKQIDAETRWEKVSIGASNEFIYEYTLVNYRAADVDVSALRSVYPELVSNSCSALREGLNNGFTYKFSYSGNDQLPVDSLSIDKAKCTAP